MNWDTTKKAFLDHWAIKLGFLVLALVLWFHVVTEDRYEFVLSVPLQVNTDIQRVVLATRLPEQVSVKFFGLGKTLIRLWLSDRHLVVPVAEKTKQRKVVYSLRTDQVRIPQVLAHIDVVEIVEPRSIEFELDRSLEKKVEVIPQVYLTFADGFDQVGSVRLSPDYVKLFGPAQFVAPVESVLLDSLKNDDVKQDIIREGRVLLPKGINLSSDPASVKVLIDVQELGQRTFTRLPVVIDKAPRYAKVRSAPPTVTLKVVGGIDLLKSIESTDFKVTIDYKRWLRHGKRKTPAYITEFPPDIKSFVVLPDSFNLVTVK